MATQPSLPPSGNPPADLVTAEELAAVLKVDPHTVLNWAKAGIIPEAMRVGRTVRFSLDAVNASLDLNKAGEGRYVELISLAMKIMLGIDYARMPNIDADSITMAELKEIKQQMDLHAANLKELATPQERAHYAEGVLAAARFVAMAKPNPQEAERIRGNLQLLTHITRLETGKPAKTKRAGRKRKSP